MIPEQNIAKFLETFDKSNKIHLRTFRLIQESSNDPNLINEFVTDLYNSGVNIQNLGVLLKNNPEEIREESKIQFDNKKIIEEKFHNYLKDTNYPQEYPPIQDLEIDAPKRQKLNESSSDLNDGEFIPGLGFTTEEKLESEPYTTPIPSHTSNLNPIVSNKDTCKDTVFYSNILPETKIKSLIDLTKDADPWYLFPSLQCKLCGLRFGSSFSSEFGLHIDDHRRFTNAIGEKVILRREFFSSKKVNRIEKLELTLEGDIEAVVWENESPICSICGKIIKKIWDDKIENWVLEQGTRINDREVAHKKCVY